MRSTNAIHLPMNYLVSKAKSAEYLRLAIEKMTKQDAAFHPVNYAVWYEYVSGSHQRLADAVDTLLLQHQRLSEAQICQIFEEHIAQVDAKGAQTVVERFTGIMKEIESATSSSCADNTHFTQCIEDCASQILQSGQSNHLAPLLEQSRLIQQSMLQLQQTLVSSSKEIQGLQEEITRIRQTSQRDSLTGLMSSNGFDRALAQAISNRDTVAGGEHNICLVKVDIDHFKRLNDSYGHLFGDKVIHSVAQLLQTHCAAHHAAARIAGNQFAILMPDTPLAVAEQRAETMRTEVATLRLKHPINQFQISSMSISVGLTTFHQGEHPDALLERVNQALSASKAKGRNQLTIVK